MSKDQPTIEEIQNMSLEDVVKLLYVEYVHVDEEGYFSDCPDFCDDCFWHAHWNVHLTPCLKEVKALSETFTVESEKTHKIYTYYSPSPAGIKYLIENCKDEIEQARVAYIKNKRDAQEKEEKAKAEAIATAQKEKEEDARHTKELKELLERELGTGYVQTSEGEMKKGELLASFTPMKKYAYPNWTAFKWADGKGVVVSHEHNHDFWQTYLYTSQEEVEKIKQVELLKAIEHPSDYLIMTIAYYQTNGATGTDFSTSYGGEHKKLIAQDPQLAEKAIENFKAEMLREELTEDEKAWPHSYRDYWYNSYKDACVYLGILEQVEAARAVRKQKIEAIKEEKKRQEEAEKLQKFNAAQEKVSSLHPLLKLQELHFGNRVEVKVGDGTKRIPKKVREEVDAICAKQKSARYTKSSKIWSFYLED